MAAKTGSTYISGTMIDSVEISTITSSRKCSQRPTTVQYYSTVFSNALPLYMYLLSWLGSLTHVQIPRLPFSWFVCVRVRVCLHVPVLVALLVSRSVAPTASYLSSYSALKRYCTCVATSRQPVCSGARDNERLSLSRLTCAIRESCLELARLVEVNWLCEMRAFFDQLYVSRERKRASVESRRLSELLTGTLVGVTTSTTRGQLSPVNW